MRRFDHFFVSGARVLVLVAAVLCVSPGTSSAASIFFEDFSDNSAGWQLDFGWQIGPATASLPGCCGLNGDPSSDFTSTSDNGVAGVVIGGDYPLSSYYQQPYLWLTSPALNTLSDQGGAFDTVTLEFRRWLNSDYPPYITNAIQVQRGFLWYDLWVQPNDGQLMTDSAWTLIELDLTPWISPYMEIRFGFAQGQSAAFPAGGWNLDDVRITATRPARVPEPPSSLAVAAGCLLVVVGARLGRSRSDPSERQRDTSRPPVFAVADAVSESTRPQSAGFRVPPP